MNSKYWNSKTIELFCSPKKKKLSKLKLWCCYIGPQPQNLQIYFKFKPINKIKFGQDKITLDGIKSGQDKIRLDGIKSGRNKI